MSSVSRVGYGSEASNNNKVMRSKSIGSGSLKGSWVKMQPHQTENEGFGRRKVKLKRSKSMGVLQGSLLIHYGSENDVVIRSGMAKLVVKDKLEKPLVKSR